MFKIDRVLNVDKIIVFGHWVFQSGRATKQYNPALGCESSLLD